MTTLVDTSRLNQVLSHVPARILALLDAWCYRVALQRAERRRHATQARTVKAAATVAQYKLEPWRD
jgi:hypothetical protein